MFLFFVTRAASLLQDATQESSGPLLRLCCRGDVPGGDEGLAHVDDGILEGDVVDAEDFLRRGTHLRLADDSGEQQLRYEVQKVSGPESYD